MPFRESVDSFYDTLNDINGAGAQNSIYLNPEKRVGLANRACDAIINAGGVVPADSSKELFFHAMLGLPELTRSPEVQDKSRLFVPPINSGLQRLEKQFTAQHADIPFVPGKIKGEDLSGFKFGGKTSLPYWIFVRSRLPYASLTDGGWGLENDRTSLEYRVMRNNSTGKVVGQVIARECIGLNYHDILGVNGRPIRNINMITDRKEVVLYEATRSTGGLPLTLMPKVNPALFGIDILQSARNKTYDSPSTQSVNALELAARIAQHRGDYSGSPRAY